MRRILSLVAALALAAQTGCPKGSAPAGPTARGPEVVALEPLAIRADAKAPDRALILGTDTTGGSTILPIAAAERAVTIDGIELTVAPGYGVVRTSGAAEPAWSAAVWRAASVAAATLGKDLSDLALGADARGAVDGAAASSRLTAGFLAALTGAPVDRSAALTGVVNLDGTIGPVGSDAAAVGDVHAAYERLTGETLPRTAPVDARAMAIEEGVRAAFEKRYGGWQKRVAAEWERILELDTAGRLPPGLLELAAVTRAEVTRAETLRRQGKTSSAYRHLVRAWIHASAATTTWDILAAVTGGDLAGAKTRLAELVARAAPAGEVLRAVGQATLDTIGDHLQVLSAHERAIAALAASTSASRLGEAAVAYLDSLAGQPKQRLEDFDLLEGTVAVVGPTALQVARAVASARVAEEALEIERVPSLAYAASPADLKRVARALQSAATANLAQADALLGVTDPGDDAARTRVATLEPGHVTAYVAANLATTAGVPASLRQEWGEDSLASAMLMLASAQLAYFETSTLISRWSSFEVKNDWLTGRAQSIAHEKALASLLAAAERKAREHARAATIAIGVIPVQARIHYQDGRVLRGGDLADQVAALEAFWAASAYAQTAVTLARNARVE